MGVGRHAQPSHFHYFFSFSMCTYVHICTDLHNKYRFFVSINRSFSILPKTFFFQEWEESVISTWMLAPCMNEMYSATSDRFNKFRNLRYGDLASYVKGIRVFYHIICNYVYLTWI